MLEGPHMGLPLKKHEMNSYHQPTHSWIRRWLKGWAFVGTLDFRVQPLITQHFPIFFSLLNQMEWSLCHWRSRLDGYRCSLSVRSKWATQITEEEDELNWGRGWAIVCFKFFEKITLDSSSVPAPYLPHFYSVLSYLKPDGCANYGFTKLLCIPNAKMQPSKTLRLKSWICFNSPITEHWTFLHQTPHVFPILYWIVKFWQHWKC